MLWMHSSSSLQCKFFSYYGLSDSDNLQIQTADRGDGVRLAAQPRPTNKNKERQRDRKKEKQREERKKDEKTKAEEENKFRDGHFLN